MVDEELHHRSLAFLDKRVGDERYFEEDFLGFYHENSLDTLALLYLDDKACQLQGVKLENVIGNDNSPSFLGQIMHPDDVERCDRGLWDFAAQADETRHHAYLQRLRLLHAEEYKVYFTCAKLNLERQRFQCVTTCLSDHFDFSVEARKLLEASTYIDNNIEVYTRFSPREREIMGWVCRGKTVTQIAEALFLSPHTVEKHKKNIAAKGKFRSNSAMIEFALNFNLL